MANGNSGSNVIQFRKLEKELETLKHTGSGNGGGEPPMELLERVIKIESKLPSLATNETVIREAGQLRSDLNKEVGLLRADLAKEVGALRADFHKEMTAQTWRMIRACTVLVISTSFIVGAIVKFGLIK